MSKRSELAKKLAQQKKEQQDEQSNDIKQMQDGVAQLDSESIVIQINANDISKTFNPREIPCTLDEFKQIEWPDINVPVDEGLDEKIQKSLNKANQQWWLTSIERDGGKSVIAFFKEIHALSSHMKINGQLQSIVVYRDSALNNNFTLIAGERRTLAALYTNKNPSMIEAKVFNNILSPMQIAIARDGENIKKGLSVYETILSKRDIWLAMDEDARSKLSLPELCKLWGYSSQNIPSILRRVYSAKNSDTLIKKIKEQNLGFREISSLLSKKKPSTVEGNRYTVVTKAKALGLSLNKKTDTSVVKHLILLANPELNESQLETNNDIAKAWCKIAEKFN